MKLNRELIEDVIMFIEKNIFDEKLSLDVIANEIGYSKYHLHRVFTSVVGVSIHSYIQRCRLNELAFLLVNSKQSILDIAISIQYERQRTFHKEFKKIFHCSSNYYRKHREFYPIQVPFSMQYQKSFKVISFFNIPKVEFNQIQCIGYQANTKYGFHVIGKCWRSLHKHIKNMLHQLDTRVLIELNAYTNFTYEGKQSSFDYFEGANVDDVTVIPKGMVIYTIPASSYMVLVGIVKMKIA